MDDKIDVAVIGLGNFGQHHVRIYKELENVRSIKIVDTNPERLKKIQKQYDIQDAYTNHKEIIGKVQAASVVTPTPTHYSISRELLEEGINLLIEKPITTNVSEANELIKIANEKNLVLTVGHVERFNPVIMEASKYINKPEYIEAYRLAPYEPRMKDVSVVLDLMIHDIDIILSLVKDEVRDIEAMGARVLSENEDMTKVRLKFKNGCIADLSASRLTMGRYRKIRIFQQTAYISLDYPTQRIKIYRKKYETVKSFDDIEIFSKKLEKSEPLKIELSHFLDCVTNKTQPLVSAQEATYALEIAINILKKIQHKE